MNVSFFEISIMSLKMKIKQKDNILENENIPLFSKTLMHLNIISRRILRTCEAETKKLDLTIVQKRVLDALIYCKPEGFSQNELARFLFTTKSNLSGVLDRMEVRGLVHRVNSPLKKNQKIILVTPKGVQQQKELYADLKNMDVFSTLNEEESKQLNHLLLKLGKDLND